MRLINICPQSKPMHFSPEWHIQHYVSRELVSIVSKKSPLFFLCGGFFYPHKCAYGRVLIQSIDDCGSDKKICRLCKENFSAIVRRRSI